MASVTTNEILEPTEATAAVAPTVLTFGRLPYSMNLFGNAITVFAQAAVLVRKGYIFTPNMPPTFFPGGAVSVMLELGSPEEVAIASAKELVDDARAAEEKEFDARVQEAAKKIVADQAKAARDAELQAQIAEQKRALAALEAAAKA